MYQKFDRDEVRRICLAGIEKAHIFLIPIDVGKRTLTFRASYWHERGTYVAEAGTRTKVTWSPALVSAPISLIESLKKMVYETCGIYSIAGVIPLDSVNLFTTMFKLTEVPNKS